MSNIRSIRSSASAITNTATKHGVKITKDLQAQINTAAQLIEDVENYQASDLSVAGAVLDALRMNQQPHHDPDVIAAVVAQTIGNNHNIADVARHELADVIRQNLDAITAAFKPVYDQAGETLATEHARLTEWGIAEIGDIDLARVSVDIAKSAVKAREALTILRDIRQALGTTRVAVGAATLPQLYIEYSGSWSDIGGHRPISDPWEALSAGHIVTLATTEEANARRDGLQHIDQARASEADAAFRDQFKSAPSLATR
ncbi:hypothetical protein [Microbacterium sp.]|uniref:hypothetical protein n=1 Tax=Microbacterium sp. TaxID=51671 RepID=UPI003F957ADC